MASSEGRAPVRRRNPRGEGEQLREQLIEATVARLDAEGDAAQVSVRAIAKAAGVSPTSLYLHFPDRDALVSAAVDRAFDAFNTALLTAADAQDEPVARLRAMSVAYLEFARRQPALYAVIFSTRRPTRRPASSPAPPPGAERERAFAALAAAVEKASPQTKGPERRDVVLTLWAALHGYATLHAREPVRRWPAVAPYVDRLMRAHFGH